MKRSQKNHYDTLGVKPDAAPEEIKRAYRKKARKAHPDAGGSDAEMAEVNRAYETLSSPSRRQLYDRTGEEEKRDFQQEVVNQLLECFNDALQKDASRCLNHVKSLLTSRLNSVKAERSKIGGVKKKLKAKRDKISVTKGENPFHLLIDQQLNHIEQGITRLDHISEVINAAMKLLDDYTSSEKEKAEITFFISSFGGTASTSGF